MAEFGFQVEAFKEFFQCRLPPGEFKFIANEGRPDNMKQLDGPVYDITGFDARQIVAVLSDIVNNKCPLLEFKLGKTFYLWIHRSSEDNSDGGSDNSQAKLDELFKLVAYPTTYQPGNGIVYLRTRQEGETINWSAKTHSELNVALKENYNTNTTLFADDIKKLFKNNAQINDNIPQATIEAYMILLFEIARRLVKTENPSDKKQQLDILPIGSAIARLIQLLQHGDEKTCTFEDMFQPGKRFHCFAGSPSVRRKAIDNINEAIYQKELQELFCYEARQAEAQEEATVVEGLKGLKMQDPDISSSSSDVN